MHMIEFANVDEIVAIVDARFEIAKIDFIESLRDEMIYAFELQFNESTKRVSFDQLHFVIEQTLRLCVATHYAFEYAKNNDEFAHVHAYEIAIANDKSLFAIIAHNDDETMRHITNVIVNDKLQIEIVAIDE